MSTKLVIDRNIWLRGEGGKSSYLLRSADGKMCCLGIYLKSLGANDEVLMNVQTPSNIECTLPIDANWLLKDRLPIKITSNVCDDLMTQNDNVLAGPETENNREQNIKELFKQNGIEVEFVN